MLGYQKILNKNEEMIAEEEMERLINLQNNCNKNSLGNNNNNGSVSTNLSESKSVVNYNEWVYSFVIREQL